MSIFEVDPIIGIRRHRLLTDGDDITTLVAFHGCPLHCAYCINPQFNSTSQVTFALRGVEKKKYGNIVIYYSSYEKSRDGDSSLSESHSILI